MINWKPIEQPCKYGREKRIFRSKKKRRREVPTNLLVGLTARTKVKIREHPTLFFRHFHYLHWAPILETVSLRKWLTAKWWPPGIQALAHKIRTPENQRHGTEPVWRLTNVQASAERCLSNRVCSTSDQCQTHIGRLFPRNPCAMLLILMICKISSHGTCMELWKWVAPSPMRTWKTLFRNLGQAPFRSQGLVFYKAKLLSFTPPAIRVYLTFWSLVLTWGKRSLSSGRMLSCVLGKHGVAARRFRSLPAMGWLENVDMYRRLYWYFE